MRLFLLAPVPFSDPLSHVKSVRTLFTYTKRTELNRRGVTYPLCTQQTAYVAAMSIHASFVCFVLFFFVCLFVFF